MRLESALYASREGLSAQGKAIAVVGDNIANANTTGYKRSRVEFADILGDTESGGAPSAGSGVGVRQISNVFDTGVIEDTGRGLDIGIGGEGFIPVQRSGTTYFTRNGTLKVNDAGLLTDGAGNVVMGWQRGVTQTAGNLSTLNMRSLSGAISPTTALSISGNINSEKSVKTTLPVSGASIKDVTAAASYVTSVSVYDSLGAEKTLYVAFTKTATNTWSAQTFVESNLVNAAGAENTLTQVGNTATLSYGTNGAIATADQPNAVINLTPTFLNGSAATPIALDLKGYTQYAASDNVAAITNNGKSTGQIKDYTFSSDGTINAQLTNGTTEVLGTVALAKFNNQDGLSRTGSGLFSPSALAGTPTYSAPGTGGLGTISGGALERSTVDIADEFINLVIYQRGYQANSKTFSTTSEILRDTIGLMR